MQMITYRKPPALQTMLRVGLVVSLHLSLPHFIPAPQLTQATYTCALDHTTYDFTPIQPLWNDSNLLVAAKDAYTH